MNRMTFSVCSIAALLVACSKPEPAQAVDSDAPPKQATIYQRTDEAPADMRDFIIRRAGCNHFWGEVGNGHPEREAQIQETLKELRCDLLESDEAELRGKYQSNGLLMQLLDQTQDALGWPAATS